MKKLEQNALLADLAATESLLAHRSEEEDPIAWRHFQTKRDEISRRLAELEHQLDTGASVALFFGGRPVVGSRGIEVEFGGQALQKFQTAVSTRLTEQSHTVGARGPLPHWTQGQMLLTDIARGSLGFVIEETGQSYLLDSDVKTAVHDVIDFIHQLASPDEETFQTAAEDVNNRVLASIKEFVKLLDDKGATLRIVEGDRDLAFPREAIETASQRIEGLEIDEDTISVTGIFYLLPDSRRFELHAEGGAIYKGRIDIEVVKALLDDEGEAKPGIIGRTANLTLARRKITARGREPRFSYRLIEFSIARSIA